MSTGLVFKWGCPTWGWKSINFWICLSTVKPCRNGRKPDLNTRHENLFKCGRDRDHAWIRTRKTTTALAAPRFPSMPSSFFPLKNFFITHKKEAYNRGPTSGRNPGETPSVDASFSSSVCNIPANHHNNQLSIDNHNGEKLVLPLSPGFAEIVHMLLVYLSVIHWSERSEKFCCLHDL